MKNTELLIFWSTIPIRPRGGMRPGIRDLACVAQRDGKEDDLHRSLLQLYGRPMADKWLAPRPGTDAALAEAIAYVWLDEDTYDKKFIEGRTIGFEEFKKHILGKTDGIKKTPDGLRRSQG